MHKELNTRGVNQLIELHKLENG